MTGITSLTRVTRRVIPPAVLLCGAVLFAGCQPGTPGTAPTRAESPGGTDVAEPRPAEDSSLSIERLIQRRAPNVQIRRSGGDVSIQIRGQATLSGRSDALVVIDGIAQDHARSILDVNPADVVRIEVLKDGAAAAYGMRGAHGVLLITTRRAQ